MYSVWPSICDLHVRHQVEINNRCIKVSLMMMMYLFLMCSLEYLGLENKNIDIGKKDFLFVQTRYKYIITELIYISMFCLYLSVAV